MSIFILSYFSSKFSDSMLAQKVRKISYRSVYLVLLANFVRQRNRSLLRFVCIDSFAQENRTFVFPRESGCSMLNYRKVFLRAYFPASNQAFYIVTRRQMRFYQTTTRILVNLLNRCVSSNNVQIFKPSCQIYNVGVSFYYQTIYYYINEITLKTVRQISQFYNEPWNFLRHHLLMSQSQIWLFTNKENANDINRRTELRQ